MKNIIWILILTLMIILALTGIAFAIYVYVRYGNTPLKDLPAWVIPFFIKSGK